MLVDCNTDDLIVELAELGFDIAQLTRLPLDELMELYHLETGNRVVIENNELYMDI